MSSPVSVIVLGESKTGKTSFVRSVGRDEILSPNMMLVNQEQPQRVEAPWVLPDNVLLVDTDTSTGSNTTTDTITLASALSSELGVRCGARTAPDIALLCWTHKIPSTLVRIATTWLPALSAVAGSPGAPATPRGWPLLPILLLGTASDSPAPASEWFAALNSLQKQGEGREGGHARELLSNNASISELRDALIACVLHSRGGTAIVAARYISVTNLTESHTALSAAVAAVRSPSFPLADSHGRLTRRARAALRRAFYAGDIDGDGLWSSYEYAAWVSGGGGGDVIVAETLARTALRTLAIRAPSNTVVACDGSILDDDTSAAPYLTLEGLFFLCLSRISSGDAASVWSALSVGGIIPTPASSNMYGKILCEALQLENTSTSIVNNNKNNAKYDEETDHVGDDAADVPGGEDLLIVSLSYPPSLALSTCGALSGSSALAAILPLGWAASSGISGAALLRRAAALGDRTALAFCATLFKRAAQGGSLTLYADTALAILKRSPVLAASQGNGGGGGSLGSSSFPHSTARDETGALTPASWFALWATALDTTPVTAAVALYELGFFFNAFEDTVNVLRHVALIGSSNASKQRLLSLWLDAPLPVKEADSVQTSTHAGGPAPHYDILISPSIFPVPLDLSVAQPWTLAVTVIDVKTPKDVATTVAESLSKIDSVILCVDANDDESVSYFFSVASALPAYIPTVIVLTNLGVHEALIRAAVGSGEKPLASSTAPKVFDFPRFLLPFGPLPLISIADIDNHDIESAAVTAFALAGAIPCCTLARLHNATARREELVALWRARAITTAIVAVTALITVTAVRQKITLANWWERIKTMTKHR